MLESLSPDLQCVVLSFLPASALAHMRAVSKRLLTAATSDAAWARFVRSFTPCGAIPIPREEAQAADLSCFMSAARSSRRCASCAQIVETPRPFTVTPQQQQQLRERLDIQWRVELPSQPRLAGPVEHDGEELCLLWPTPHGCHAWLIPRGGAEGGSATNEEIATCFELLLSGDAPNAASDRSTMCTRLRSLPALHTHAEGRERHPDHLSSSRLCHLALEPVEWGVLEKRLVSLVEKAMPHLAVPPTGSLGARLQQQRRASYLALCSAMQSSALAIVFDRRRCERCIPPDEAGISGQSASSSTQPFAFESIKGPLRLPNIPLTILHLPSHTSAECAEE
jgi:hypothetical protein